MAQRRIDELTAATELLPTDLVLIERDPTGSKVPRKITAANLALSLSTTSDPVYYVSNGSLASDDNDGKSFRTPFATLAAAKAALGIIPGRIIGGLGSFPLTTATDGYTFVLEQGQYFEGIGEAATQISVDVAATWGPMCRSTLAGITDVTITNTAPVDYLCGVSTPDSAHTSSFANFQRVFLSPQGLGGVQAGFAVGPDFAGSAQLDIATTVFEQCVVLPGDGTQAGGVGICEAAFKVGNGTSGNILQTSMKDCAAAFCRWGVWMGGCGVSWEGAGMTGMEEADFFSAHSGGESVHIRKYRGEGGKMLFSKGYTGEYLGGVILDDCSALQYTPDDGETVISCASTMLLMIGGDYQTGEYVDDEWVASDCKFEVNPFGGDPQRFTAINVCSSSLDPYRGVHAVVRGLVIGGIYRDGPAALAVPIEAYDFAMLGAAAGSSFEYIPGPRLEGVVGSPSVVTLASNWRGLAFDATIDEYAVVTFQVPDDWTAVDVILEWVNAGAGSGDVVWFAQVWHQAAGETLSGGGTSGGALATAGAQNVVVSSVIGEGLEVEGGAVCNLMVIRSPTTEPTDTLPNDAAVLGVRLVKG